MDGVQRALQRLTGLSGLRGAVCVDYFSRLTLGVVGVGDYGNLRRLAEAATDLVRGELDTLMSAGHAPERVEDIVITLDDEVHLIWCVRWRRHQGVFVYVVLDRHTCDLATTRVQLRDLNGCLRV